MPVLDLSQLMTLPDGTPVGDDRGTPIPLGKYCEMALLAALPDDSAGGDEKYARFRLAMKLAARDERLPLGCVHLEPEEIVRLKSLVGRLFPPLVVGRIFDVLNA